MLLQGDAQSQPSGRAIPSLTPGPRLCLGEFFRDARNLNPAVSLLIADIPDAAMGIASRCVHLPSLVLRRREEMPAASEALPDVLGPVRPRWVSVIPANSHAAGINFPMVQFRISHFGYADSESASDLAHGMPIARLLPDVRALNPRSRSAFTTFGRWRADLPSRNRRVLERVGKSHDSELVAPRWGATLADVRKGWAAKPIPFADAMLSTTAMTPPCAISEERNLPANHLLK